MFKNGVIPSKGENCEARELLICSKCGFKYWYFGNAEPPKKLKCLGCQARKQSRKVKRNPRVINRNNPAPFRR